MNAQDRAEVTALINGMKTDLDYLIVRLVRATDSAPLITDLTAIADSIQQLRESSVSRWDKANG